MESMDGCPKTFSTFYCLSGAVTANTNTTLFGLMLSVSTKMTITKGLNKFQELAKFTLPHPKLSYGCGIILWKTARAIFEGSLKFDGWAEAFDLFSNESLYMPSSEEVVHMARYNKLNPPDWGDNAESFSKMITEFGMTFMEEYARCRTRRGFFGICPQYTLHGDEVQIILGAHSVNGDMTFGLNFF